jgi:hypothetical protein
VLAKLVCYCIPTTVVVLSDNHEMLSFHYQFT